MHSSWRFLAIFGVVLIYAKVSSCMNTARCTPPTTVNCKTIIEYMKCNGYKIQDCIYIQQSDSYLWRIDDQLSWNYGRSACRLIPNGDMASLQNFEEMNGVAELGNIYSFMSTTMLWLGMRCNLQTPSASYCNQTNLSWTDGTSTNYIFSRNQQSMASMIQASPDSCMQTMPGSSYFYFNFVPCGSSSATTICKAPASVGQKERVVLQPQDSNGELPAACDQVLEHFKQLSVPVFDCVASKTKDRVYFRIDRYSMSDSGNNLGWQFAKTFCRSMSVSEMVTLHDFDDWQSAATLARFSQMGSQMLFFGLIVDGTSQKLQWIDGTPFDYNNTQMPITIPPTPGVDYCGFMMNMGPFPSSQYQIIQCNQTNSFQGTALCYLPVGQQKQIQQNDQWKVKNNNYPNKLQLSNHLLSCAVVIDFMKSMGYSIIDCTERDETIYYKINSLTQNFDVAQQACKKIDGSDAISIHNSDEAILARWIGCSGYGTGSQQYFTGLKCGASKCRPDSLVWSDGSPYDYKVIDDALLNSNDTSNHCFVSSCGSQPYPNACVSNGNTGNMGIICKAVISHQKKRK